MLQKTTPKNSEGMSQINEEIGLKNKTYTYTKFVSSFNYASDDENSQTEKVYFLFS